MAVPSITTALGAPRSRTNLPTSLYTAAFTRIDIPMPLYALRLSARVTSRIDVDICLPCIELSNWVGVPSCRIGWEYPYTSIHTSPPGYHVHCRHSSFRIYSLLIRVRLTSDIPCPGLSSPMDFLGVPLFHTTPPDSSGIFPSAAHSMCFLSLSGASLSQELRPHLHWHMLYWMHLCRTV